MINTIKAIQKQATKDINKVCNGVIKYIAKRHNYIFDFGMGSYGVYALVRGKWVLCPRVCHVNNPKLFKKLFGTEVFEVFEYMDDHNLMGIGVFTNTGECYMYGSTKYIFFDCFLKDIRSRIPNRYDDFFVVNTTGHYIIGFL